MKKDSGVYGATRPSWDKKDCSVRALAVATGVDYTVASATFCAQGRVAKNGTSIQLSVNLYENVLGMKRVDWAEGMKLGDFLRIAPTGSFVVHKLGHAFAVVEGIVCDWESTSRENTVLIGIWKVTDVARAKMRKMEALLQELMAKELE